MTTTGSAYLQSLANTGSTTPTPSVSSNGTQTLTQSDFLSLLTAQLQNQDPTDPTDNSQMLSQMAQFSETTGVAQMNQTLTSIQGDLASSRVGGAANWIGKNALVPSNTTAALSDGSYAGTVTLPAAANQVNIMLSDSSGNVVYNGSASNVAAGDVPFDWNGKDSSGNAVAGPLKITVNATDTSGNTMSGVTSSSWTPITGVQSPASGATMLVTSLGTLDPTTVTQLD